MIIRDEDVQAALDWLNQQPHPTAVAKYKLTEARNLTEEMFSTLYPDTEGQVRDRECLVEVDSRYVAVKKAEAIAELELENAKRRDIWADKITDLYQTVSANTRYAERIR